MLSSPFVIALRKAGRKIGLNRLIASSLAKGRYEDRFGPALQAEVKAGDIVWDIGANVGLYTAAFAESVGADGRVVAFEPSPACFEKLREKCSGSANVIAMNVALGDADGQVAMSLAADPLGATHRIVEDATGGTVVVEVRTAGSVASERPELFPQVIKIDVEGYEGLVMDGMEELLADQRLRCVGIEVHFGLLEERGEAMRPRQLEESLRQHGFSVRWTDPSHLLSVR